MTVRLGVSVALCAIFLGYAMWSIWLLRLDLDRIWKHLGIDQEAPAVDPEPQTVPEGIPTQPQAKVIIEKWADGIEPPRPTPGPRVVAREIAGRTFTFREVE